MKSKRKKMKKKISIPKYGEKCLFGLPFLLFIILFFFLLRFFLFISIFFACPILRNSLNIRRVYIWIVFFF